MSFHDTTWPQIFSIRIIRLQYWPLGYCSLIAHCTILYTLLLKKCYIIVINNFVFFHFLFLKQIFLLCLFYVSWLFSRFSIVLLQISSSWTVFSSQSVGHLWKLKTLNWTTAMFSLLISFVDIFPSLTVKGEGAAITYVWVCVFACTANIAWIT